MVILDNQGNHTGREAFLENDQPADSSVPILKRMDPLKVVVKINDIFYSGCGFTVFYEQGIGFVNIPRLFLR